MQELTGRVAVVTGAASGIGLALARRFAQEGMRVALADVERDALMRARDELAESGADAIGVVTDVSQADSVQALAEATLDAFGKVHVVCNNAGVFAGGVTWESPLSDYEWVFGVNVWGVLHGIRTFVPILLRQGEPAHVVNTVSMAGLTTAPLGSAYFMSKHAALALSECLYHELAGQETPVGVSVLCPEIINTGIGRSERNRPPHLKREPEEVGPGGELIEGVLRETIGNGLDPSVMAERVVDGIRSGRFYLLSEEGGSWRRSCETRLEDIRLARNPTLAMLASN
jgi:NAD(P)-dependent dehydrogenase (short-subunit alcohol dehydrogenase family)